MIRRCAAAPVRATRRALCVGFLAGLLLTSRGAVAQEDTTAAAVSNVPPEAAALVVAIRSYQPGRSLPQIGAGEVVGMDDGRLFIATALHVVDGADRI